jgi:hypothetical protein
MAFTHPDERPRPFFVRPADGAPNQGRQVPFATHAEDAALQYIELWPTRADGPLSLIVEDCATGQESCLTLHLHSPVALPRD